MNAHHSPGDSHDQVHGESCRLCRLYPCFGESSGGSCVALLSLALVIRLALRLVFVACYLLSLAEYLYQGSLDRGFLA